jgi:hypothetical protein
VRDTPEIAAARIGVERARGQLLETLRAAERSIGDFLEELTPRHIMREAWDGAKEKGADLAENAVDAVKARPLAATGVVAAIAMFLAREPLIDLAGQIVDDVKGKRRTRKPRKAKVKINNTEAVDG